MKDIRAVLGARVEHGLHFLGFAPQPHRIAGEKRVAFILKHRGPQNAERVAEDAGAIGGRRTEGEIEAELALVRRAAVQVDQAYGR